MGFYNEITSFFMKQNIANKIAIITLFITILFWIIQGMTYLYEKFEKSHTNTIDVSIDLVPKNGNKIGYNNNDLKDDFNLIYKLTKSSNIIQIKPQFNYFELINKGKKVKSIISAKKFESLSPEFQIKIINNKEKTLLINSIEFKIEYSKPILKPIPIVNFIIGNTFATYIRNDGWEKMINCSLEYYFFSYANDKNLSSKNKVFTKNIGEIEKFEAINFSNLFSEWGMDTDYLKMQAGLDRMSVEVAYNTGAIIHGMSDSEIESIAKAFNKKLFKAYGKLKDKINGNNGKIHTTVGLHGKLMYQYYNRQGQIISAKPIKFSTPIWVCMKPGAPLIPKAETTYDISLEYNKSNYTRVIDQPYTIKPMEAEILEIKFSSERYSKHKIKIIAHTNQGELILTDNLFIDLLIFNND